MIGRISSKAIAASALSAAIALAAVPVEAGTSGAWRRWPWRNGYRETLTQVDGHAYASRSARRAIDVAMDREAVHSIGPGTIVTASNGRRTGNYLQVAADDGSVVTYEHLSSFEADRGEVLAMGDLIAVSGDTGNVTGPHLHFQRSRTTSFRSAALAIPPIDGVRSPKDGVEYPSANAGIGTDSGGRTSVAIRSAYAAFGGWAVLGAPQTLTPGRTPCWSDGRQPTRWMYDCLDGLVQTFEKNDADSALLANDGTAFMVRGSFHVALVSTHPRGFEYLMALGFPRSTAYADERQQTQVFERGWMYTEPGSCSVLVGVNDEPMRSVWVC